MILPCCATCSSPRLKQFPTSILPSKTPLLVLYFILRLTITLTRHHPLFHFLALVNPNFVLLPRWALWDHPERKQTILQKSISSPHPTRRKLLQPWCGTSHQESRNSRNFSQKKYQLSHPLLRGSTLNIFSYMIKFASLNQAIQMLSFGRSLIPSVKLVFDSGKVARPSSDPLIEPATSFSSPIFRTHPHGYNFFIKFYPYGIGPATGKCASILFTLFPGDYDNLLQWPFSKLIHIGIRDQLDPLNTWMKTIRPDQDPAYKKPTISTKTGVVTLLINNFIPHSKLINETEGFLIDGASFIEIIFSDPPVLKPNTQTSLLFPSP